MNSFARIISPACFALAAISALASAPAQAQSADTSFFLTSNGIGNGGNLGGLAGADNHCQTLAQAAGAGGKTWRAYLSTQAADGAPAVNARDRIGKGPWKNAKGAVVAKDVAELHSAPTTSPSRPRSPKRARSSTARGDTPNRHDVLTGSQPDGTAFAAGEDRTCKNWTSSTQGAAMVGHSDRKGLRDDEPSKSWNYVASLARPGWRLLAGRPEEHRRRRADVLLRGELTRSRSPGGAKRNPGRCCSPGLRFASPGLRILARRPFSLRASW